MTREEMIDDIIRMLQEMEQMDEEKNQSISPGSQASVSNG
jgi:hypothetical protein